MPSSTFHPCVPDNVQTTVQTQPDQKTGLVKTEWITPSGGTVPGPLGTEKIPRECPRPPNTNPIKCQHFRQVPVSGFLCSWALAASEHMPS